MKILTSFQFTVVLLSFFSYANSLVKSKVSLQLKSKSNQRQAAPVVIEEESPLPAPIKNSESPFSLTTCAALVAGTTIGGGFIALPYVTIPIGAKPSIISIIFCWTYLLFSAFSLAQASLAVMKYSDTKNIEGEYNDEKLSVFRIARFCFGPLAGTLAGGLFVVLMLATLVAQLSKAGSLGASILPILNIPRIVMLKLGIKSESIATVIYAAGMAALTFLNGPVFADKMNMVLTALMVTSFGTMVSLAPSSGWKPDGLHRADFSRLLPSFVSTNVVGPKSAWIIPVILQLLVYSEVIPLICTRLKDETKVNKAILYGSIVPLLMCIVWTVTAIGLLPFGSISLEVDPVDILMAGSLSSITSNPIDTVTNYLISKAVSILAFSAVSTTVIGSFLTIAVFVEDILSTMNKKHSEAAADLNHVTIKSSIRNKLKNWSSGGFSYFTYFSMNSAVNFIDKMISVFTNWVFSQKTLVARMLAIVPATLVAGFGSRSLYFAATAFAGSFPVTMLWGLFPPLACLQIARKQNVKLSESNRNRQLIQILISIAMLAANLILALK